MLSSLAHKRAAGEISAAASVQPMACATGPALVAGLVLLLLGLLRGWWELLLLLLLQARVQVRSAWLQRSACIAAFRAVGRHVAGVQRLQDSGALQPSAAMDAPCRPCSTTLHPNCTHSVRVLQEWI